MYVYIYIYIYIYIHALVIGSPTSSQHVCMCVARLLERVGESKSCISTLGRGVDTVGNPHRAQISLFDLFELVLLLKVDKQSSTEQLEPTVSQSSTVSPPSKINKTNKNYIIHQIYRTYINMIITNT